MGVQQSYREIFRPNKTQGVDAVQLHWEKPVENCVKVNFDAAFQANTGLGAWGFIARSDTGNFITAVAGKLQHLRSALQAETEACVAANEGAAALGLHRIIFLV
jgi:phage tail protein X